MSPGSLGFFVSVPASLVGNLFVFVWLHRASPVPLLPFAG